MVSLSKIFEIDPELAIDIITFGMDEECEHIQVVDENIDEGFLERFRTIMKIVEALAYGDYELAESLGDYFRGMESYYYWQSAL